MPFSQMNWSLPFKILRGRGTREERKNFSFDFTGSEVLVLRGRCFVVIVSALCFSKG